MIAAMAAVVSPASTLVSGLADLSGGPAFVEGVGPLEAIGVGAGVDGCAAGPLKATGCGNAEGQVSQPQQAHCSPDGGLPERPPAPSAPMVRTPPCPS